MSSNPYTLGELAPAHSFEPPKKRNWALRIAFVFVILAAFSLGSCVTVVYRLTDSQQDPIEANSTLVLPLQGSMALSHEPGLLSWIETQHPLSVDEVRLALDHAATDDKITDAVVIIHRLSMGFGMLEALREIFVAFRASQKPLRVLIEGEWAGAKELYLAAAGSSVTLSPQTKVRFTGLSAELSFFGATQESLDLSAKLASDGAFGRALKSWTGRSMSEPMQSSIESLLEGTWSNVVAGIARDRSLQEHALRTFAARGSGTGQDALTLGLVDKLGDEDQFFGQRNNPQVKVQRYLRATQREAESTIDASASPRNIALIVASGDIVLDSEQGDASTRLIRGKGLAQSIRAAASDENIAAILLWVESSGGSMMGADLVWRELQRTQKPVVVSMGSVAASGGYWISAGADAIVAAPSTVTGSIGVIYGRTSMQVFLRQLATLDDPDAVSGVYPRLGTRQRLLMEGIVGHGYQQFVTKVAKGRHRSVAQIEAVAQGRLWTGRDARTQGLVDRVGGLLTAVQLCKEKMKVAPKASVQLRHYPSSGLWQHMFARVSSFGGRAWINRNPIGFFKQVQDELAQPGDPRAWARAPEFRLY